MITKVNAQKEQLRLAWFSGAAVVFTLCFLPIVLRSQPNQATDTQKTSGDSRAQTSADAAGWSSAKLGEPLLRDPVWVTENAGNTGTIIRYNISRNDRTRGITIAGPVKNTLIYNNTIYTGADRTLDMLLFADWNGWSEETYFYNNIFYAAGPARFSHGVSRAPDGAYTTAPGLEPSTNNVFESNLYYGVNPVPRDANALTADPKLANPTRGGMGRVSLSGYHLQPTSAARASGKLMQNNGTRDFWGNAVPSCNKTDRGASQSDNCEAVAAERHER